MTDRLTTLLAEAPGLERASELSFVHLPVAEAFEQILPHQGLRPGSTVRLGGVGATSLALALVARASRECWTAAVGLPALGLHAAVELGVDLDRLVVVPDPGTQWEPVLAALVDAFDVVLVRPGSAMNQRRVGARVRERDAVLVVVGAWTEADLAIQGTGSAWLGIGRGHGHLAARTLTIDVSGRGQAARVRSATLWLPGHDGEISIAQEADVLPFPVAPGCAVGAPTR